MCHWDGSHIKDRLLLIEVETETSFCTWKHDNHGGKKASYWPVADAVDIHQPNFHLKVYPKIEKKNTGQVREPEE